MMTSAQVVETSVNVTPNSPSQDYTHPDDHNLPNYEALQCTVTCVGESAPGPQKNGTVVSLLMLQCVALLVSHCGILIRFMLWRHIVAFCKLGLECIWGGS